MEAVEGAHEIDPRPSRPPPGRFGSNVLLDLPHGPSQGIRMEDFQPRGGDRRDGKESKTPSGARGTTRGELWPRPLRRSAFESGR